MDLSLLREVFRMKDNHLFWCQMGGGVVFHFKGIKTLVGHMESGWTDETDQDNSVPPFL